MGDRPVDAVGDIAGAGGLHRPQADGTAAADLVDFGGMDRAVHGGGVLRRAGASRRDDAGSGRFGDRRDPGPGRSRGRPLRRACSRRGATTIRWPTPGPCRTGRQWWSGITPSQEELFSYRQQAAGRNLYCLQYDGGNVPFSIPINIWTIQCLQTETAAGELPIDCQLARDGNGFRLTITNRSKLKLAEGYVQIDPKRRIEFGAVGPGETKEFSSELPKALSWDEESREGIARTSMRRGQRGAFGCGDFLHHGA